MNTLLWVAVILFAIAAVLRVLVCLGAIALAKPIDAVCVAAGLAFFAGAFLVT